MLTTQKRIKLAEKRLRQAEKVRLRQSNIEPKRTFRAWFYELRQKWMSDISAEYAEMFYNGGYSPKMTYLEVNRIPLGWEAI